MNPFENMESALRMIKGLLAAVVAMAMTLVLMPLEDSMINSFTTPGSLWAVVARMAMWGMYILIMIGAPILVVMGRGTILGILEGAFVSLLATILVMVFLPVTEMVLSSFGTSDFWLFAAQETMWLGFIAVKVLIPAIVVLGQQKELGD